MNWHPAVVPFSRRCKNLQWHAKEEELGCPRKVSGRHVGDDSLHFTWTCAQVTGKAGENGQNSGEVGGSSAWTRPPAPECGDTLEVPPGHQRPI